MSTYSNLKIELMQTGQNATSWGDVTNVNLGTAIEEALVGSADISFASGSRTLSLADDNGPQDARNLRLRCTGATADTTLTVPSIKKVYIIANETSYTITVKTASDSGVPVPAGKIMWVYSTGTAVTNVGTHLTSLTLGTALPVASGGTGANTAANARTNLGLGSIATQNSNSVVITGGSITGITDLAVADGGTGASTNVAARANLLPTYTGNGGKILAVNSGASDVEWIAAGGIGTVTSINANSSISGLSFANGPITAAGTLTLQGVVGVSGGGTGLTAVGTSGNVLTSNGSVWVSQAPGSAGVTSISFGSTGLLPSTASNGVVSVSGTLAVGSGGTGTTSLTSNAVLIGNGTSSVSSVSPGTSGNVLTSNGSTWVSQAASGGGSGVSTISFGSTGLTPSTATNGAVTVSGTLAIGSGGTGANSATNARTNLGLGTMATQASSSVSISGGTISGGTLDAPVSLSDTGTIAATSPGFRGLPQSSNTTLALTDAGKHIYTASSVTIPANGTTAFPVGTTIVIANSGGSTLTISITTDTLRQAGTSNTGTRTLAVYGMATLVKVASTTWYISGNVT